MYLSFYLYLDSYLYLCFYAHFSVPVVHSDDNHLSPGGELVAREVVARAVRELAAVDVEHDRQQLRLA